MIHGDRGRDEDFLIFRKELIFLFPLLPVGEGG
jgi:hypothetical protein